jgi:hypothetical protein
MFAAHLGRATVDLRGLVLVEAVYCRTASHARRLAGRQTAPDDVRLQPTLGHPEGLAVTPGIPPDCNDVRRGRPDGRPGYRVHDRLNDAFNLAACDGA